MLRPTTLFAAILIALSMLAAPATAQDEGGASDEEAAKLDRDTLVKLRRAARRLESDVGRLPNVDSPDSTNPEALARTLRADRDPERVFEWMRQNIRYEPYEGAIRGVSGTLISRRANAADQALLAHAIFEADGVETRFVIGDVPDKAWEKLGKRLLGAPDFEAADGVDIASTLRGWDGLRPSAHVWIEVEHDGTFKAFDPVLSERYGTAYGTSPTRSDALPERFVGTFEMKVHSRLEDGQHQVVNRIEGTLADFMGEPITLAFKPNISRENHVEPTLQIGEQDSDGRRMPTDVLERLWIEFEMQAGGRSYRMQKVLYASGATPELFGHDQQVYAISVLPGWVQPHWARAHVSRHLESMADAIDAWSNERIRASDPQSALRYRGVVDGFLGDLAAALPPLYALEADRAPLAVADALHVIPVMSTPRIIVTGVMRSGSTITVDFWRDGGEIDAVGSSKLPASLASGLAAITGYDDAKIAESMFGGITEDNFLGVERVFGLARSQGVSFGTIHQRNSSRIGKLDISEYHRELLRDHVVEGGELVLAPQKAVSIGDRTHMGWWSITPSNSQFRTFAPVTYAPASATSSNKRDVQVAGIIRAGMAVESELSDALAESDPSSRICKAAGDAAKFSRAFCAQKKLQDLPSLKDCLEKADGGSDLLGAAGSVSAGSGSLERKDPQTFCNQEARTSRCGLVVANAVLAGEARIVPNLDAKAGDDESDETDEDDDPAPAAYCE